MNEYFECFCRDKENQHWDIWNRDGRIFAIRGKKGNHYIRDERRIRNPKSDEHWTGFAKFSDCIAFLMEQK